MTVLYEKIKVIHFPTEREPFAILDKPRGLPSAPLKEGDPSALTWALETSPVNSTACPKIGSFAITVGINIS